MTMMNGDDYAWDGGDFSFLLLIFLFIFFFIKDILLRLRRHLVRRAHSLGKPLCTGMYDPALSQDEPAVWCDV